MREQNSFKQKGMIGTVIFHLVLLLALFFLALHTPLPLPGEEGVEVSLGNSETGSGLIQPENSGPAQEALPEVKENIRHEEIVTQDVEETAAIPDEKKEIAKPEKKVVKEKPVKEKPAEKITEEPKVNPNALYTPNKNNNKTSGSQGNSDTQGDQGKPNGSKESTNPDGTSGAGNGVSFDLEGRSSLNLPKPAYESKEQGKVVVTIWVNSQGRVVRVIEGAKGTTVTDLRLLSVAKEAALKAAFSPDAKATDLQKGTITYNFIRLN